MSYPDQYGNRGNWPDSQGAHRRPQLPEGPQRPWQPQPAQRAVRFGGAEGNERLTAMTGVVLLAVLAVKRFTILRSYTGGMQHVTTGAPWRTRS